jgi:hypothetical protein
VLLRHEGVGLTWWITIAFFTPSFQVKLLGALAHENVLHFYGFTILEHDLVVGSVGK